MKYACNGLKHQDNQKKYFHNFEAGQSVLGFRKRDGKMYYKIQKDKSKEYSGTGPRVFVTLGPTLTPRDRSQALGPGLGEYRTDIITNVSNIKGIFIGFLARVSVSNIM